MIMPAEFTKKLNFNFNEIILLIAKNPDITDKSVTWKIIIKIVNTGNN